MTLCGAGPNPRRRTVEEAAIIEILLTLGWVDEVRRGERALAELQARQTLDRLVGLGLGFQPSPSGQRRFDPAEVVNFAEWASLERADPFWSERCVPLGRRFTWAAHGLGPRAGACPPPPTTLGPRRFSVRLRRLFNLQGRTRGSRVRLRLPLPIEDHALGDLVVTILPSPDVDAEFAIAEARLDVLVKAPPSLMVELGFEAAFTAYPGGGAPDAAPLDPAAMALYTRPSEGLIKVGEPIRRLAADLAGDEPDPWAKVGRFWAFILDRLSLGVVHYEDIDRSRPCEWILQSGWCDCQLASALMAALCRAQGVPARMISGYVMDVETPYDHYWVEAWIDGRGWTPVDTLSWYFSHGGRDPTWRDYYLGQIDYRMKTECLPHLFNGPGSIRFPAAWNRLLRLSDEGLECSFHAADTGALIYRDQVAVVVGG